MRIPRYLIAAAIVLAACSNNDGSEPGADTGQVEETDIGPTYDDRYEFCAWRTFSPTEDAAADLVGDWVVFEFDTDAGMHVAYRLFDDEQFWAFPVSNGCEAERDCFLSGGAKLCEDARKGTWSVDEDNGALTLDGSVWSARTGRATHTFERGAAQLMFYAADCEHECIAEPQ